MANLFGITGAAIAGDATDVHSTQMHTLGTRAWDDDGNEYIYLKGVASNAANLCVTYDELYSTTLSTANAVGPIAVSQAAVDATTEYGWFGVRGKFTVATADDVADNKALSLTATAGKLDDADAAGDAIVGLWSRSSGTGASTVTAQLDYPKVHDIAID